MGANTDGLGAKGENGVAALVKSENDGGMGAGAAGAGAGTTLSVAWKGKAAFGGIPLASGAGGKSPVPCGAAGGGVGRPLLGASGLKKGVPNGEGVGESAGELWTMGVFGPNVGKVKEEAAGGGVAAAGAGSAGSGAPKVNRAKDVVGAGAGASTGGTGMGVMAGNPKGEWAPSFMEGMTGANGLSGAAATGGGGGAAGAEGSGDHFAGSGLRKWLLAAGGGEAALPVIVWAV